MHRPQIRFTLTKRRNCRRAADGPEDACAADMLVMIRWQDRNFAVPLSQLIALDGDDGTDEAISDWHYWLGQGYTF